MSGLSSPRTATMAMAAIETIVVETSEHHVVGDLAAPLSELHEQSGEGIADHAQEGPEDVRLHSSPLRRNCPMRFAPSLLSSATAMSFYCQFNGRIDRMTFNATLRRSSASGRRSRKEP
jgi:hypothetical protein